MKHEPWITQAWTQSTPWQAFIEKSLKFSVECLTNPNMVSKPQTTTSSIIFYPKSQQNLGSNALFMLSWKAKLHNLDWG